MRIIYFDLLSGASGDMLLSSLIDAGFPVEVLNETIKRLPLKEVVNITIEKTKRNGVLCTLLKPKIEKSQEYRHREDILNLISGNVPEKIYSISEKILNNLAEAEAKVHGVKIEQVHFHEIGAVDTIIDILGFCTAIEYLKIDKILFSKFTDGQGYVKTEHGVMPIPVPATLAMIEGYSLKILPIETELLTPTGAAILTSTGEQTLKIPDGKLIKTGYGCGEKVLKNYPNFIRSFIIESKESSANNSCETVALLESDMDHISGEIMGEVSSILFEKGALDVSWIPIYMKKNRPAYRLSVIAPINLLEELIDIVIYHTRTLGVRIQYVNRVVADRETSTINFDGIDCKEKRCSYKNLTFTKLEYESLSHLAKEKNCSVIEINEKYIRNKH